jgi:hypothetical protein
LCHFVLPYGYIAFVRISIDIESHIYLFKLITKHRPVNLTLVIIFWVEENKPATTKYTDFLLDWS